MNIDNLNTTSTARLIPFKCVVCSGFGTVTKERIKCHGCKGSGYLVIDQSNVNEIVIDRKIDDTTK